MSSVSSDRPCGEGSGVGGGELGVDISSSFVQRTVG